MGNHLTCVVPSSNEKESIRLIHSDGIVEILYKSLNAGKIMERLPEHLVCHTDSFYIGQKIPPLSPKEELKMGHQYFILPKQSFQSVLSLVSLASVISPCKPSTLKGGRVPLLAKAFDMEKRVDGGFQIKICAEFISKLMEEGRFGMKEGENGSDAPDFSDERLCSTPELQKHYAQLVTSRIRVWRPNLETIREKQNGMGFKINFKRDRRN